MQLSLHNSNLSSGILVRHVAQLTNKGSPFYACLTALRHFARVLDRWVEHFHLSRVVSYSFRARLSE